MPICANCKDFVAEGAPHACPGPLNPPAVIHNVMSVLGPMLTTKDLVALANTSKGLKQIVSSTPKGLAVAREMWEINHAFSGKGKLNATSRNFIGEGVAARLLRGMFPNYRAWDRLTAQEQAPLRVHFDANNKNPVDMTPDYVITVRGKVRVADCFSLNYPKLTPFAARMIKAKQSLQAIANQASFKWNKYGRESIAVANLVDFPDDIPTETLMGWISECSTTFKNFVEKENLLFVVRDPLIVEFVFWT